MWLVSVSRMDAEPNATSCYGVQRQACLLHVFLHLLAECKRLQGLRGQQSPRADPGPLRHCVGGSLLVRNPLVGWLHEQEINLYCVKPLTFGNIFITIAIVP